MIDRGRQNILGIGIDAVDCDAAVGRIVDAAEAGRPLGVSALAVHGIMTGVLDRVHRYRLNQLELVVPDGQPVRWALNLLHGVGLTDRVYGPNLMLKACARAAECGLPIYLYGSTPEMLTALVERLKERYPALQIAGTRPSRFRRLTADEQSEVVRDIRESGAKMVFVGLGCPRQEIWAYEFREPVSMPVIAVGAAFAFHAGHLSQAPARLQNAGLEWLYRLVHEPKRLWKRYVLLNPLYLSLLLLQYLGLRRFDPRDSSRPTELILHG